MVSMSLILQAVAYLCNYNPVSQSACYFLLLTSIINHSVRIQKWVEKQRYVIWRRQIEPHFISLACSSKSLDVRLSVDQTASTIKASRGNEMQLSLCAVEACSFLMWAMRLTSNVWLTPDLTCLITCHIHNVILSTCAFVKFSSMSGEAGREQIVLIWTKHGTISEFRKRNVCLRS